MRIQAYTNNQYNKNVLKQNNQNNNPSFGSNQSLARTAFEKLGQACNVDSRNGSLTRTMFFIVGTLFMLGGRFFESRDNDEKREVVTRDVPAVLLSVAGAPTLNKAVAYATTKKTGIPIVTMNGGKGFLNANFTSQKQLIDWYSELGENALVNFSETVNKHGGNLQKAFKKLGFTDKLNEITKATKNSDILNAINNAKANNTEAYQKLEAAMKGLGKDNSLLKFAKKSHAYVKLAGIGFMAAVLGFFLPRLNIVLTRKKYEGKVDDATFEKKMMRTSPVFRVSSGVLSFHKSSAQNTFRNLLSMMDVQNSK